MTRRIVVVQAGLSDPSSSRLLADRIADASRAELTAAGEQVVVETIDLRPLAHALADNMLTGFASGDLAAAQESVAAADGLIVVTPVFQASYSGLFKMFFDVVDREALVATPVLMAATAGTARHSLVLEYALRPLFAHLRATPVPTAVFAASEDWGDTASGALADRIRRAAGEFAALVSARPASPTVHEVVDADEAFGADVDFAALLRGA